MNRQAHQDITWLIVFYACLLAFIVAGRWGWGALALYGVAAVPSCWLWLNLRRLP